MVNSACRAALQLLREHFSTLGDQSPIQCLSLDEGAVVFAVRSDTGEVLANVNICWTETDNYPNSGCILFGHDVVSALNERFQDRGELGDVVAEVLRALLGRDFGLPRGAAGAARDTSAAMDEDTSPSKPQQKRQQQQHPEDDGDAVMEEGSDVDWDNVGSASGEDNDEYGGGDGDGEEGDDGEGGVGSGDDGSDQSDQSDDDDERELIILCSTNLGRWERYEAALEAAAAGGSKRVLSTSQGVAAKRQIFNPREAFTMLSRELLDFLRGRHVDCSVETDGDDLYHWVVDLGSFAEGSGLARDMREVARRYVYSSVRLRLRFLRGLHPFFPPSVEVVWPHLSGPLLGAVASHPMLRLENWDPWRPAMETVAQIKAFLETNAHVDLDNPVNDIRLHPASTYSPLERGLARLEALSGVPPACLADPQAAQLYAARDAFDRDSARLQALAEAGKKRGRTEAAGAPAAGAPAAGAPAAGKAAGGKAAGGKVPREVVWARGTGYGVGHNRTGELWDAKATEAAQRARDAEIQSLLDGMSYSLRRELGPLDLPDSDGPTGGEADGALQAWADADASTAAATAAAVAAVTAVTEKAQAATKRVGAGKEGAQGASTAGGTTEQGAGSSGREPDGVAGGPTAMEGVETAAVTAAVTAAAAAAGDPAASEAGGGGGPDGGAGAGASGGGDGKAVEAEAAEAVAAEAEAGGSEPLLGPGGCAAAIRSSCLLPFIVRELQLASFNDMGARHPYFTALLVLVRELCRPATGELLRWEPPPPAAVPPPDAAQQPQPQSQAGGPAAAGAAAGAGAAGSSAAPGGPTGASRLPLGRCVADILRGALKSAARVYLNILGPAAAQAGKAAAGPSTSIHPAANRDKAALAAKEAAKEAAATQRLARIILTVVKYLDDTDSAQQAPGTGGVSAPEPSDPQQQQPTPGSGAQAGGARDVSPDGRRLVGMGAAEGAAEAAGTEGKGRSASGAMASTSGGGGEELPGGVEVYLATMRPLQMDTMAGLGRSHHYATNARGEQVVPRTRAVRLAKEIASLESLLPLSESSSVFVRVDETAVQLWKAIIIGPEDTPYSGGCFVFDFYFPAQYPNAPPQVHLLTTGGGRVRFNPNLYNDGKVCLSLLGTWSGDRGESWNSDVSTAVQVLISIQSLILVPEPYFNEPSYEAQTGEQGKNASREYTKNVRENCVRYAMLDVLRHPPAAFAPVVKAHFQLRKTYLLNQLKSWADEGREAGDADAAGRLMEMRRDLEALIAASAAPGVGGKTGDRAAGGDGGGSGAGSSAE